MATHVALLHSIVLGAGKRLVMTDLKAMAEGLGFAAPRTLAATGNLIFEAGNEAVPAIEVRLEEGFQQRFEKHVDILVRTKDEWLRLAAQNPFPDIKGSQVGVRVMRQPLAEDALAMLRQIAEPGIRLALVDGDLWIDFGREASETRLLSHLTTKKLGIGTLRNANTVNRLCPMFSDVSDPVPGSGET
ncbi:DUF1697 domain-containing protein [Rhizobium sp. 32-5/1]|uniref:DUF1697 domain-containing protein n=1 Tax=Rhizobium sp. 32-5/1 TaxID=3019602 RepID=UPI00240DBCDE|nr:DUF1697 domain-containing protein [Rhizobium sp. 32-5/1]WEZ83667.1 DUF1697 domain-containing protein [Rhizobium sp. 32-5/1]